MNPKHLISTLILICRAGLSFSHETGCDGPVVVGGVFLIQTIGKDGAEIVLPDSKSAEMLFASFIAAQEPAGFSGQSPAGEALDAQSQTDSRIQNLLIIVLLLTLGLLAVAYNRYKIKSQAMRALNEKNVQIQRQRDEIEAVNRELQQKFLRAQMDPHFIFNSLSAIQYFITAGDQASALRYLSSFSTLLRQILDNSEVNAVTLAEELKWLKIYLDLEAVRFNGNFRYEIKVAEDVDAENAEAPFFMIQPYVENALKHGFRDINKPALVRIHIFMEDGFLVCTVEDNGIGRKAAGALPKPHDHVSRGLEIAKKRLELLNRKSRRAATVDIHDLYDHKRQCAGTKIEIKIPQT